MVNSCCSSLLLLLWSSWLGGSLGLRVHSLHWNSSNPMFRIDNTDHILDVNQGNMPWEYDQVNLICPWYNGGPREGATRGVRGANDPDHQEQYIIYNVSKEEYDSCRINQESPRVVAVCNDPLKQRKFTITFRSFSPVPGGLEFHPGKDYFFISTSWQGDLYRKAGGSCTMHNMKVIFKVANPVDSSSPEQPTINTPRKVVIPPDLRPIEDVRSFQTGLDRSLTGHDRYQRRNSPVKQEASTMSSSNFESGTLALVIVCAVLFR